MGLFSRRPVESLVSAEQLEEWNQDVRRAFLEGNVLLPNEVMDDGNTIASDAIPMDCRDFSVRSTGGPGITEISYDYDF